jgi:hypothetical protein
MVKFRAVKEEDREEIVKWMEGRGSPEPFLCGNELASVYAIDDEKGTVMYVRTEANDCAMRIHIQFCLSARRSFNSLKEGFPVVRADAKNRGFREIVFDSVSPALIRHMIGMGFRAEMKVDI